MTTATVEVKEAWWSKINWAQIIALLATVLAVFGIPLTAEQQVAVIGGIQVIQSVVTIIIKTYFSSTVTPQSLPSLPFSGS